MSRFNKTMKQWSNETMERGVSLYLALMIMTIVLAIGLGISTIIIFQMKMIRGMGDSVIAIFAADTGIERILYEDKYCRQVDCTQPYCLENEEGECQGRLGGSDSGNVGEAFYQVEFNTGATSIRSTGVYKGIRRAIEVTR